MGVIGPQNLDFVAWTAGFKEVLFETRIRQHLPVDQDATSRIAHPIAYRAPVHPGDAAPDGRIRGSLPLNRNGYREVPGRVGGHLFIKDTTLQ